ncbi:MAG: hypothetical protein A3H57_00265 [Candidatus Taylorbacteria bacterium RIFCSPLOWO2_02_FULL_43_11]|uniref:Uncharacterized protein n=1 Tax=Candidatus Taylorbacteria bacterium RIFCSPHIGHO2_02_FULL_43_32b TaxID=1802306 RepID=A0A1G2MFM2_9BACT|nr:MAG: hypothetical protein A2743_00700 [Candidatus Taylorbacteria bacterium RIFCSPHIGHO2_01_FULL_43_47]OHA22504.1 MAG: hypothetical protein A3C72_00205 [Candidatus Taylorbacteria bacterium RIFCSPHIGHO2_02_FULL_43_32b]OHA35907.1 MAG: hypothetical protein A3H57_00265 [Candidatus Taylorbacteria bacterium RIFCSPLOWO2_02_FULL_43_11]
MRDNEVSSTEIKENANENINDYSAQNDQLYQSFSPFDLSEILSREAELIERHYQTRHDWTSWGKQDLEQFRKRPARKKHFYD